MEGRAAEPKWEFLLEAVARRHDCVHRNGIGADGTRVLVFTREYVAQVIGAIERLVRRIEGNLVQDADYWLSGFDIP